MELFSREDFKKAFEKRHGKKLQEKLEKTTVAICGLGGLGSNIAILLARAGLGHLILIDFDKIDISNLHRQQYKYSQVGDYKTEALKNNLKEISPFTKYKIYNEKITEDNMEMFLSEADIICEAFDNAESKAMLVDSVLVKYPKKILISASGMAGLLDGNLIKTRKITDRFYLCGDEKSEVNYDSPLFATRVSICASHQAHMVVQLINDVL